MTDHKQASKVDYAQPLKRIPSLALSACFCALILKLIAAIITSSTGKGSGFDEAAGLLMHYPQSSKAIFAFFAAVIFLWSIPILLYPSDLGRLLHRWVVIPSLHIVEHMLCLALGVLLALAVIDLVTGNESLTTAVMLKGVLISGLLGLIAVGCSVIATFTANEFESIADTIPRLFRVPLFLVVGSMPIGAVFIDFVWNYKPTIVVGH